MVLPYHIHDCLFIVNCLLVIMWICVCAFFDRRSSSAPRNHFHVGWFLRMPRRRRNLNLIKPDVFLVNQEHNFRIGGLKMRTCSGLKGFNPRREPSECQMIWEHHTIKRICTNGLLFHFTIITDVKVTKNMECLEPKNSSEHR